jgi:hypothetical protein
MEEKSLVFETKPEAIEVEYVSDDLVRVKISGDMAVSVEFNNDVMLSTKGDFTIATEGELSLVSKDNPINIDTVDSKLYLNSRQGKLLKDLPESKEYLERMKQEQYQNIEIATMAEMLTISLKERTTVLETQVKQLLEYIDDQK